jgi:hypothetical protein
MGQNGDSTWWADAIARRVSGGVWAVRSFEKFKVEEIDQMTSDTTSIRIGQLCERVGEEGRPYLTGALGLSHLVIMKSDKTAEDGAVVWDVYVQQVAAKETEQSAGVKPSWHQPAASDELVPNPARQL